MAHGIRNTAYGGDCPGPFILHFDQSLAKEIWQGMKEVLQKESKYLKWQLQRNADKVMASKPGQEEVGLYICRELLHALF